LAWSSTDDRGEMVFPVIELYIKTHYAATNCEDLLKTLRMCVIPLP
jgi:hypothetical protein